MKDKTAEEVLKMELGCNTEKNQTEPFDYLKDHNWADAIFRAIKFYAEQEREKAFVAGMGAEWYTPEDFKEYKHKNPLL